MAELEPVFCKTCGVCLGDAEEHGDFLPYWDFTVSVAGVGTYCSHGCRDKDPQYFEAMRQAGQEARARILRRLGSLPWF